MCDDCSTDNTFEIAMSLASKDKRISVLRNNVNMTLAPTLNKCISIAKGKYIARMDGDDVCSPDRLEKEVYFLEHNTEYALVSCQMNLFDKNGIYRVVSHKSRPEGKDLVYHSQFCHAGYMMRTSVIKKLAGYSSKKSCQRVEDYDLWIRMYSKGYKGYNLQEVLYSMRDDRKALRRRNFSNRINESILKYRICKEFKLPLAQYVQIIIPLIKWLISLKLYGVFHSKLG